MASALSKEMGMMELQLNRWKDIANEALSLREEAKALRASLTSKVCKQSIKSSFPVLIFELLCDTKFVLAKDRVPVAIIALAFYIVKCLLPHDVPHTYLGSVTLIKEMLTIDC